ncbi:MAG: type II toxin-antitoxin system RelE family toxin [Candidatus Limnocylindria bacterium]
MESVALSRRAVKDLRRIGAGEDLDGIGRALEVLASGAARLDVKPLRGQSPWHRLRVGDYRILYRAVDQAEGTDASHLVARMVHRRDLERAVSTLE